MSLPDVVTVLTVLKRYIESGIQIDADTRASISSMSDEEIFQFARELVTKTDEEAGQFIERLNESE